MNPPIHLLHEIDEGGEEESAEVLQDRIKYLDSLKISVGGGTIKRVCDVFVLSQSWDTTDERPPAVPVRKIIVVYGTCYLNKRLRLPYVCIEMISTTYVKVNLH